jgi:hypothetical protein
VHWNLVVGGYVEVTSHAKVKGNMVLGPHAEGLLA